MDWSFFPRDFVCVLLFVSRTARGDRVLKILTTLYIFAKGEMSVFLLQWFLFSVNPDMT